MSRYNFLENTSLNTMRFDSEKNLENKLDIKTIKTPAKTKFYFTCNSPDCGFSDLFYIQNMISNRVLYRCTMCSQKLESVFYSMVKNTFDFQKTFAIKNIDVVNTKTSSFTYDWYRILGDQLLLIEILDSNHLKKNKSDKVKYDYVLENPNCKLLYIVGANFDKTSYEIQKLLVLEAIESISKNDTKIAFVLDTDEKFKKHFETKVFPNEVENLVIEQKEQELENSYLVPQQLERN